MNTRNLVVSLLLAGGILSGCYYPPPGVNWVDTPVGKAVSVGGVVREPTVVARVNPESTNAPGFAQARLVIGSNGAVRNVEIVSASDNAAAASAKTALSQWKFVPTFVDGSAVQVVHEVRITFK
jgi:hypothetical protein